MRAFQYLTDLYRYNSLREWLTAAVIAAVVFVVVVALRSVLVKRLGALAERTTNHVDDMIVAVIAETRVWVLAAFGVLSGVSQLQLPPRFESVIGTLSRLVFLWQTALWGVAAIAFWV